MFHNGKRISTFWSLKWIPICACKCPYLSHQTIVLEQKYCFDLELRFPMWKMESSCRFWGDKLVAVFEGLNGISKEIKRIESKNCAINPM